MAYEPDPKFRTMYTTFTADPNGIGPHFNDYLGQLSGDDPLLIATGTDFVVFPGRGQPPVSESFRLSSRGFIEVTGTSHLGVAVPYLVRLRELKYGDWEKDAHRLIKACRDVRSVNNATYWTDHVAAEAYRGIEGKIADMIDYSCAMTIDYLERGLKDPSILNFPYLRNNFLEGGGKDKLPVAMNDMMAATFALAFLDIGFRIMRWLDGLDLDWPKMMVIVTGQAGRPTAGVTWQTNSSCHLLWRASGKKMEQERLFIAPYAPALDMDKLNDKDGAAAIEAQYRTIWFASRATIDIGRLMFDGYPAFHRAVDDAPVVTSDTKELSELPVVRSEKDRRAIITRLRFVMEDPAQQLANAGAQFIVDQLADNGNRPDQVVIPGFTNLDYPRLP